MLDVVENKHFLHTVEKTEPSPCRLHGVSFNEWLVNTKIPYCELLRFSTNQPRLGFGSETDRNLFLLEFLGEFRVEKSYKMGFDL